MSAPNSLPTPEQLGLAAPAEAPRESELFANLFKMRRQLPKLLGESTILVVDPSIGSERSQPGYALFRAGALVDFGVLEVGERGARNIRLHELSRCLREDFADITIDVLVVEDIPPARVMRLPNGRVFKNVRTHIPIHRAVGAIQASVPAPVSLEVPPQIWHAYIDESRYVKSDATDAVAMGFTVLQMASYILANPGREPVKKRKRKWRGRK